MLGYETTSSPSLSEQSLLETVRYFEDNENSYTFPNIEGEEVKPIPGGPSRPKRGIMKAWNIGGPPKRPKGGDKWPKGGGNKYPSIPRPK